MVKFPRLVTAACVVVLVLTSSGTAKEAVTARLLTRVPLQASPTAIVRVEWSVDAPRGAEIASNKAMFVRLLSRTGARPTISFANRVGIAGNRYSAMVRVPAGGIGGVRVGYREASNVAVELENDPFQTPSKVRCDAAALEDVLSAFVRAYNRGDTRQLDRLFSRQRFRWYASTGAGIRLPPEARKRGTLAEYFRERHRRRDHLILRSFRFNAYERARNLGHFEFDGHRRANDFQDGGWVQMTGKGALDCSIAPPTISVMIVAANVS